MESKTPFSYSGSILRNGGGKKETPSSEDERPLLMSGPEEETLTASTVLTERTNGMISNGKSQTGNGHDHGPGVKNGMVQIDIDEAGGLNSDHGSSSSSTYQLNRFPKEPLKLLVALVLMFLAALINDLVLAYAHERIPDTPPLPDIFFSHTPALPWALPISEYLLIAAGTGTMLLCFFHKHRWIVFRRVFFISSLLYFGRAISMFVTQVPVADPTYYCAPKLNRTDFSELFMRALSLVSGVGLKINGKHTLCGDYVYSGHTLVLVMAYLVVREYSPKRWWPLHWLSWLVALSGVTFLLLSRGHYSLDVIIAYWVSTRLFWLYHTLCANPALKESSTTNLISRVCWFPLFKFMECNVTGVVPRRFESPLPSPRRMWRWWRSKSNLH